MKHASEVMQGMSAAGAMQIVCAIANGHTMWSDLRDAAGLNQGRMSLLLAVMKRKHVIVQPVAGGPYQLTRDAIAFYAAALEVQAAHEAAIIEVNLDA